VFFFVTFSPVRKPVVRWVVDFLEGAGKRVNKAKTTYDTTASTRLKSQQARKSLLLRFCMGDKATGRIAWPCIGCWNEPSLSHTDTHTHTPVYYGCMPCADRISRRRRRFFLPVSGTKRGSIVVGAFLGDGLVCGLAFVLPLCAFSLSLSFFCCFLRYVPTYVRTVVLHAGQSSSFRFGSGDCEQRITERVRLARSPPSFRPAAGRSLLSCLPCIVHSSTRALLAPAWGFVAHAGCVC
jgi:hypothetical protein